MYGITERNPQTMEPRFITSAEICERLAPLATNSPAARQSLDSIRDLEKNHCSYTNQDFDVLAHALSILEKTTIDHAKPTYLHAGPFDVCLGTTKIDGAEGQLWRIQYGITLEYRFAPNTPENKTPYGPRHWFPVTTK